MGASSTGHPSSVVPESYVLGVGCERGTPKAELDNLVSEVLKLAGIAPGKVKAIASIDDRRSEPGVRSLADRFACPLLTFSAEQLEEQTPRLINPSEIVFAHIGCHGVAEAAALTAVGEGGTLVIAKTKSSHATAALAKAR